MYCEVSSRDALIKSIVKSGRHDTEDLIRKIRSVEGNHVWVVFDAECRVCTQKCLKIATTDLDIENLKCSNCGCYAVMPIEEDEESWL